MCKENAIKLSKKSGKILIIEKETKSKIIYNLSDILCVRLNYR